MGFFFVVVVFERDGRGDGDAEPTAFSLSRNYSQTEKNERLWTFLGLHLLWLRCPCPLDLIHLLGEDGVGVAPAGGNADSQMPRRRAAERRCRLVVRTRRRRRRLWRCTMEKSPEQSSHPSVLTEPTEKKENISWLLYWRHSQLRSFIGHFKSSLEGSKKILFWWPPNKPLVAPEEQKREIYSLLPEKK